MLIDLRSQWEADDPSLTSSAIAQLAQSFRNVRNCSLYAWEDENLLAGYFPAEQFRWNVTTDRMARASGRWTQETYPDNAWLYSVQPVVAVFDPATFPGISQLTDSFRNIRNGSLYALDDENLLAGYFPAHLLHWTIPADRMGSTSSIWKTDTHHDQGWLTENIFTPAAPFDPALFPAIAELIGVRTPTAASLAVAYYLALYDLGWVHDVIPLTDPVPGAEIIHLRPIAPVMSARRRNKRRR